MINSGSRDPLARNSEDADQRLLITQEKLIRVQEELAHLKSEADRRRLAKQRAISGALATMLGFSVVANVNSRKSQGTSDPGAKTIATATPEIRHLAPPQAVAPAPQQVADVRPAAKPQVIEVVPALKSAPAPNGLRTCSLLLCWLARPRRTLQAVSLAIGGIPNSRVRSSPPALSRSQCVQLAKAQ